MHAPVSIAHGLALALSAMPLVAASALAVPAPQLVVIDGNQQMVVPRAEPKLPTGGKPGRVRRGAEEHALVAQLEPDDRSAHRQQFARNGAQQVEPGLGG